MTPDDDAAESLVCLFYAPAIWTHNPPEIRGSRVVLSAMNGVTLCQATSGEIKLHVISHVSVIFRANGTIDTSIRAHVQRSAVPLRIMRVIFADGGNSARNNQVTVTSGRGEKDGDRTECRFNVRPV